MKEEYRQVFDQVHASERLREEVAQMTKLERRNPKKRFPKGILIAAAILAVLAGSAIATVGMPGTLQGWFAQQWTEQNDTEMSAEQLAFIDHLTEQVGVQDTQNDVTVTLDSVTAGDSSIWLLLKISGSYEEDEEHRYDFGMVDLTLDPDPNLIHDTPGGSGLQTLYSGTASDGVFTVLLQYTIDLAGKSTLLDEPRSATLVLEDLNRKEIGGDWEGTPAAEGTWTLAFSLTPGEADHSGAGGACTEHGYPPGGADHHPGSADLCYGDSVCTGGGGAGLGAGARRAGAAGRECGEAKRRQLPLPGRGIHPLEQYLLLARTGGSEPGGGSAHRR